MSLLITGGAGFCGLNIAARALERGETVVSYGLEAPIEAAVRAFSRLPGRFVAHAGDVCDRDALRSAMATHGVRRVVHAAAITASLDREASQAARIIQVNLGGTLEVLEAALAHGVERVVQLSSGSVYGANVAQVPSLDEVRDAPVPDSLYGISKYAAERMCVRFRATRGLDVTVARLGVVFGRWEHDTGVRDTLSVPWQLAERARRGEPARLNPVLPEDWVYAADVAAAIGLILDAPRPSPQPVYHVSAGRRWSAQSWCALLRQRYPAFEYALAADPAQADVGTRAPTPRPPFSVRRIEEDYGFEARFDLPAAFEDYMAWRDDVAES